MSRLAAAIALWMAFVFVAWNVIYDRYVAVSALEFTREQIQRHQRGDALTSIHDAFSPRVGEAAWRATMWVAPLVLGGAVSIYVTFRRAQ
jgi:hypothetical protein